MSVHVLLTGNLLRAPERKISAAGKQYTRASLKVGGADNAPVEFWSALIFSQTAQDEIARLEAGDRVSLQGALKLATYTAGNGETRIDRTVFVDHALALKPAPRVKKPKQPAQDTGKVNILPSAEQSSDSGLNDDIPF